MKGPIQVEGKSVIPSGTKLVSVSVLDGVCFVNLDSGFLNQDYEFPTPESVQKARRAVLDADGIWIFTPEYNYQIPGVLKNLLDWLSRPFMPDDRQRNSVLKGKPVTISGVAGKSAAFGARKNLSALAQSMSMKLIADEGSGISLDSGAWSTDVLSLSEENIRQLKEQADLFIESILNNIK